MIPIRALRPRTNYFHLMSHIGIVPNNRAVGDWSCDLGILLGSQTRQRHSCPCIRREWI